jgi:hypothetical protein
MVLYSLSGITAVILLGYGITRLAEYHTLNNLPPVAALFECSLRRLYRMTTCAERARLRQGRKASTPSFSVARIVQATNDAIQLNVMRAISWIPSRAYRGFAIQQTFARAMIGFDRVVDNDAPPSTGTRQTFFDEVTYVIENLADPGSITRRSFREILALIYTARATTKYLAFNPAGDMQQIWRDYTPDAVRIQADEPVAKGETLELAYHAYFRLKVLEGLAFGLNAEKATLFAELDTRSSLMRDMLEDLVRDAQMNQFAIPQEEFDRLPFSAADLHGHSGTFDGLAKEVPGLALWCVTQAQQHGSAWENELLPKLIAEVLPYIQPAQARRWCRAKWQQRDRFFRECAQIWQGYVPEATPTEVPWSWTASVDFYAAVAAAFHIPVSDATRKRWTCVSSSCFWLDYLLDDSPEPITAQAIYSRLLSDSETPGSDLPEWPFLPDVIAAADDLKRAIQGLGSRERIVSMLRDLGKLAPAKTGARSAVSYARLVEEEDTLYGELLAYCMSDDERNHPAFQMFRRWSGWFYRSCGLSDAMIDLRQDLRKNLASVRPSRVTRLVFDFYYVRISLLHTIRHPRAFLALAKAMDSRQAGAQLASTERR